MKIGDRMIITTSENRVFVISAFSLNSKIIPDGWPIDESGSAINPKYCRPYTGATSVFKQPNANSSQSGVI